MPDTDVLVDHLGSIVGLTGMTEAGRNWIADNCEAEPWQWQGLTLNIESGTADDILDAMRADGLTVSD